MIRWGEAGAFSTQNSFTWSPLINTVKQLVPKFHQQQQRLIDIETGHHFSTKDIVDWYWICDELKCAALGSNFTLDHKAWSGCDDWLHKLPSL